MLLFIELPISFFFSVTFRAMFNGGQTLDFTHTFSCSEHCHTHMFCIGRSGWLNLQPFRLQWLRGVEKRFLSSSALALCPAVLAALAFAMSFLKLIYFSNKAEDLFGFYLVSYIGAQNYAFCSEAQHVAQWQLGKKAAALTIQNYLLCLVVSEGLRVLFQSCNTEQYVI